MLDESSAFVVAALKVGPEVADGSQESVMEQAAREGAVSHPALDDDLQQFEALLTRASIHSVWADLHDLDGWLLRAEAYREEALRDYDALLEGVSASATVDGWTAQIDAGILNARLAPVLVGAGRSHRHLGRLETASMWLQGALLVSSAAQEAGLAAAAFVELAEAMADDVERSVGFAKGALDCLPIDEPNPLRARALTRLAEEGWRAGQDDEADEVLKRVEEDASARADLVHAAECRSLRGDARLASSAWSVAAERYLEFADMLLDAYPLYVAGRMAHRGLAILDLARPSEADAGAAQVDAQDAALALARCGQVGLAAQVDALRDRVSASADNEMEAYTADDLEQMGDLCAAVGRDLAVVEQRTSTGIGG